MCQDKPTCMQIYRRQLMLHNDVNSTSELMHMSLSLRLTCDLAQLMLKKEYIYLHSRFKVCYWYLNINYTFTLLRESILLICVIQVKSFRGYASQEFHDQWQCQSRQH